VTTQLPIAASSSGALVQIPAAHPKILPFIDSLKIFRFAIMPWNPLLAWFLCKTG